MERRKFIRNAMITAAGTVLSGTAIRHLLKEKELIKFPPLPPTIER